MESTRFLYSYKGTFTLVEDFDFLEDTTTYTLIDSKNEISLQASALTCYGNGLMLRCSLDGEKIYFGSIISNKWDEFQNLATRIPWGRITHSTINRVLVAGTGDNGQYRLVFWDHVGSIWTLDKGQSEWVSVRQARVNLRLREYEFHLCTDPVALNTTTMVCLNYEHMELMEYDHVIGTFKSKPFTIDWVITSRNCNLVAWEGKLYILKTVYQSRLLEIWAVSSDGSSAALMNQCSMKVHIHGFTRIIVEKNIRRCFRESETGVIVEVLYDMEKKSLVSERTTNCVSRPFL